MFNAHPPLYDRYENRIYFNTDYVITVAFLIAGLCVGLPALVWALWVIYKHHKNRGYISVFIILLLINDLLELLLTAIDVLGFLNYMHINYYFCLLLVTFRINGVYLHQLVALESILSYKHKKLSDLFFSAPRSIILCFILFLIIVTCQLMYEWFLNLVLCILPLCILAVTCTLTCKATPPNRDPAPPTGLKPGSAVLIVATLTLFAFTVQAVAVFIILQQIDTYFHSYMEIYLFSAFLVSLRVISDPLLFVLVCKEKLRAQTHQTQSSELNTEHQSV